MALNFPNSPTDGQVYTDAVTGNRYVYSSGSQRWNFSANGIDMSVSTDKPLNPQQGDLWWNSDYGRMFVYYTDADSSQWVEASPVPDVTAYFAYANSAANNANSYAVSLTPNLTAANNWANTKLANSTVTLAGTLTTTGAVVDSKGDTRDVPSNDRSSSMPYTITISDTGKMVLANGNTVSTSNVFVPNNVFFTGNTLMITNISTNTVTIRQNSGVTMFLAGTTTTGNRSLAGKGIATLMCVGANNFIISGAGLS